MENLAGIKPQTTELPDIWAFFYSVLDEKITDVNLRVMDQPSPSEKWKIFEALKHYYTNFAIINPTFKKTFNINMGVLPSDGEM